MRFQDIPFADRYRATLSKALIDIRRCGYQIQINARTVDVVRGDMYYCSFPKSFNNKISESDFTSKVEAFLS